MADLFNRDAVLTIDNVRISAQDSRTKKSQPMLRFTFKIVKSTAKDPNTAEIAVYNLSAENRARFQQKNVPVVLEAGYVGRIHQIFSGVLHYGISVQEGTDWITKAQSSDGGDKFKSARVNVGLKGPVTAEQAIDAAAKALGIPLGNAPGKTSLRDKMKEFTQGLTLSGKAELQVDKVLKAFGLSWSIQDGAFQVLGPKETVGGETISLEVGTGLIGSPQAGEDGIVKARSLLQPELLPGRAVKITSRQIPGGTFRVEKVTFTGDTHGGEWYSDTELKPV